MTSFEDQFNNISGLFDPFHLLIPKLDKNLRMYKEQSNRYNAIYTELWNVKGQQWLDDRGIKPFVGTATAGGNLPGLPGLPEFAAGDLTRTDGRPMTEQEVEEITRQANALEVIAANTEFAAPGGSGDGVPVYTDAPTAVNTTTYIDKPLDVVEETVTDLKPSTNAYKELKKKLGDKLIHSNKILLALKKIMANKRFNITKLSAAARKESIEKTWSGNFALKKRVLKILNSNGLSIAGKTDKEIVELFSSLPSISQAHILNEIMKSFEEGASEDRKSHYANVRVPLERINFSEIMEVDPNLTRTALVGVLTTNPDIEEKEAEFIIQRLKNLGTSTAEDAYKESSDVMNSTERAQRAILTSIYEIAETSIPESRFSINPRLILKSILNIMNVPERLLSNLSIDDFINWRRNLSGLGPKTGPVETKKTSFLKTQTIDEKFDDVLDEIKEQITEERPNNLNYIDLLMDVEEKIPELKDNVEKIPEFTKKIKEELTKYQKTKSLRERTRNLIKIGSLKIKAISPKKYKRLKVKSSNDPDDDPDDDDEPDDDDDEPDDDDDDTKDDPEEKDPEEKDPEDTKDSNDDDPDFDPDDIGGFEVTHRGKKYVMGVVGVGLIAGAIGISIKAIVDAVNANGEVEVKPGGGSGDSTGGGSGGGMPTDPDHTTFVDYEAVRGTDESEGLLRAEGIDPAEANLFLNTGKQARAQQRMWDSFSMVEPGHSLGSLGFNTIAQHNKQMYDKRFSKNFKIEQKPTIVRAYKADPKMQPRMVPIYQNDYGEVQFEDDTPQSDYQRRNQLTDERLHTDRWREYENANNIYQPEGRLMNYRREPVMIPEIRTHGYDRYLPKERPSRNGGVVYKDSRGLYNYSGGTMPNDNFNKNEIAEKDPTSKRQSKSKGDARMMRSSTRF